PIIAFAGAILYHNISRREKKAINYLLRALAIAISIGMFYYMSYKFFKYISEHFGFSDLLGGSFDYISYALLGVAFTAILFYCTRKTPSAVLNKLLIWVCIVFATSLISQILTRIIKPMASRPRYRAMFVLQDFTLFKNWFEFQSKPDIPEDWVVLYGATSDWFKSFPSGHTSAGSLVITLTLLPSLFDKSNNLKSKIIVNVVVLVYIFAVMLNRLVVGAHFLTDVTVGLFVTIISYYISLVVIRKIFSKVNITPLSENRPQIIETAIE
ncbi:MAG: phosphatase PAP2 family protein, partial [Clostridia bacterium]|nr:phosphatase PAP2 family protein [Clostridia bacterium]